MSQSTKISIVLLVGNGQDYVTDRVEKTLATLQQMFLNPFEVIVVDDGSCDATPEITDELQFRHPQVRVVRHGRPRGFEAAGQSGLERAVGELVFIQEQDCDVRFADLQRLLELGRDESVVAARAESAPPAIPHALLRRLRAWGTHVKSAQTNSGQPASLQMIRRPHLQKLAGPKGASFRLHNETIFASNVETM